MKFKLTLVSADRHKKDVKEEIVLFVENRYLHGKDTTLQDIQDVFQNKPYNLSRGTVVNYLNELVENKKLSTWYKKGRRYYAPPKIPLPIKMGVAVSVIIVLFGTLFDIFASNDVVKKYVYMGNPLNEQSNNTKISTFPIVIYCLTITILFSSVWYVSEKYKK